jgi:hypothetical protein
LSQSALIWRDKCTFGEPINKLALIYTTQVAKIKYMKTIIFITAFLFLSTGIYGQSEERFIVKGTAKLIATWSGKTLYDASGTLASGDKISITTRQIGIYVNVIHNNVGKQLVTTGGEDVLESTIVKVYEYDFDSDGQKEIIVIHSPEFSIVTVEVFRYSAGLTERVGNFNGQFDVILEKNSIYLPYGSQGLGVEYLYMNGAFFELVYHDPDQKEE